MSTQLPDILQYATEAECAEFWKEVSHLSDLVRHRKTQRPDDTGFKAHCPYPGCEYKTAQRSDLIAQPNARHPNGNRRPCPGCDKGFTEPDPTVRTRHRKAAHGYQPYPTPRYYARRVSKEAEKPDLKRSDDQRAANPNIIPPSTQSAPSPSSSSAGTTSNLLANTTYQNDFWKSLLDLPRRDASEPEFSQDAQRSAHVALAPARDSPETPRSDSGIPFPKVESDGGVPLCGCQLDRGC